jgi:hypothetical protein
MPLDQTSEFTHNSHPSNRFE